jgi:hypothetical protein
VLRSHLGLGTLVLVKPDASPNWDMVAYLEREKGMALFDNVAIKGLVPFVRVYVAH